MNVSVLLLTHNEELNLPRCLNALRWCDDIVIVDSGSTDNTVEIARECGAQVLKRPFDDFASQRNFGLDNAIWKYEWILHLDADEIITQEFERKLQELEPVEHIDAYLVPSKLIFFGKWLRHAGMYPTYQARLGRCRRLRFKQVGHGQREDVPNNNVAIFEEPYLHYSFSHGLRRWLERHVQYADAEAKEIYEQFSAKHFRWSDLMTRSAIERRRALKTISIRIPLALRPLVRFCYVFFIKKGFLDGTHGFLYALMLGVYEGMTSILVYERALSRNRYAGIDDNT
jgi:glycosyltransferase involved in cell wall biosynthesis